MRYKVDFLNESDSPMQVLPSLDNLNPGLHLHLYDPNVFRQMC